MKHVPVFLVIIVFAFVVIAHSNGIENQLRTEANDISARWADAILMQSNETLTSYALPEYKVNVERLLNDASSEFYKHFLGEDGGTHPTESIRWKLSRMTNIDVYIEKVAEHGYYAYFFDGNNIKSNDFQNMEKINSGVAGGEIVRQYFFRIGGSWYADYEIQ